MSRDKKKRTWDIARKLGIICSKCRIYEVKKKGLESLIIKKKIKVALAGIPNTGKSVVFNSLTGGRAWVGNWPGTTVEKKVGRFKIDDIGVQLIDLPGTYTLSPESIDQKVARDAIINEKPDVVVNLLNATNLERSLYLTISLLETGVKVIAILNFMDLAKEMGYKYDVNKLMDILGIPVVPMIAIKKVGLDKLKKYIKMSINNNWSNIKPIDYGDDIENYINKLITILKRDIKLSNKYVLRWLAIKLLEYDEDIRKIISSSPYYNETMNIVEEASEYIFKNMGSILTHIYL